MKKYYIGDLLKGNTYTSTFAVQSLQTRTTKTDKPYLVMDLSDKTGSMTARMWDEIKDELEWAKIKNNQVYEFEGRVEEYQGKVQFIVSSVVEVSEYDRSDYLPEIKENVEELWGDLRSVHQTIENDYLKKLVDSFFTDEQFVKLFKVSPAAKSIHDSSLGGLLRHTWRMTNLALDVMKRYPEMTINRDLVIAGIAFHDMEKMHEYDFSGTVVEYTDTGHFVGHTLMACNSIYQKIRSIEGFPKNLEDQIIHIVAAHAGEYDPIRLPSTLEANIVHLVDFLDSRLVHFQQEKEKAEPEQKWKKDYYSGNWMYFGGDEINGGKLF
jgi:3'-5' exoribonuclease